MSLPLSIASLLLVLPIQGERTPLTDALERQVSAMGTTLGLQLVAPTRAQALAASEAAIQAVEVIEQRLSSWRADSELSRLNRSTVGESFALSSQLASELERAFAWRETTRGAFDPAVLALVKAWDLRGVGQRPNAEELQIARRASGPSTFRLEVPPLSSERASFRSIVREAAGAGLDAGGFGKGAALDAALASLRNAGIVQARLDFGGQVAVLSQSSTHRIRIASPDERERAVLALHLERGSIATSGNSERALAVDGERIGHLLDPRTGMPAQDFGSVTVWCASAFDADCLSTALFVLGPERALEFADAQAGVEAVVLERTADGLRARATRGLRAQLHTLDANLNVEWFPIPTNLTPPGQFSR